MKIIEAMKQIKNLRIKAEDLKKKVALYHAHLNFESPTYGQDQKKIVDGWLQSYGDILKEILRLRVAIQITNINTPVTIELGNKPVTKSIAEWIHRRRDLAELEKSIWETLNDKGLKEGQGKNSTGDVMEIKIIRYYSPSERDDKIESFRSEPMKIDSTLEVINAVTDLIE